jgi:hypothetical protein
VVVTAGNVVGDTEGVVVVDTAIVVVAAGAVVVSGATDVSLGVVSLATVSPEVTPLDVDVSPQAASANTAIALIASNRRLITRRWRQGASLVP